MMSIKNLNEDDRIKVQEVKGVGITVKMKVKREDIKTNRECLRWILIIYYYNNFINIPVITAHVPKKEKMKISIHLIQKSFTE